VPLQVFELVFRPAEELRVLDRRRVVEGRERGKTYVHASDPGFGYLRQKLSVWRFAVSDEVAYQPSASRFTVRRFTFRERSVDEDLTWPMLEIERPSQGQLNRLRNVSELYLSAFSISGTSPSSQRSSEGAVDAVSYVLDGLAVDCLELLVESAGPKSKTLNLVRDVDLCSSSYLRISSAFRSL